MPPLRLRLLPAVIASLALVLPPFASHAESRITSAAPSVSASIDIRIVIPAVLKVLENSHPAQLETAPDGSLTGDQRLVVVSTMKHGFCLALQLAMPGVGAWQLDAIPEPGVTLQNTGSGYRVCSARPGRYTLVLQHRFGTATAPLAGADRPVWPVQTDIVAL